MLRANFFLTLLRPALLQKRQKTFAWQKDG